MEYYRGVIYGEKDEVKLECKVVKGDEHANETVRTESSVSVAEQGGYGMKMPTP